MLLVIVRLGPAGRGADVRVNGIPGVDFGADVAAGGVDGAAKFRGAGEAVDGGRGGEFVVA